MLAVKKDPAAGFTLIELLVSMLFTFILLGVIYSVYRVQLRTVKVQERRQEAMEYARSVIDLMVREVRNAGHNPHRVTLGAGCLGGVLPGPPGLLTATADTISFSYDYRGDATGSPPDGDCADADEQIRYRYLSPGPRNCPSGRGDILRTANGTEEAITNCNVTQFALEYFARGSSTPMSPVVAASVQRVRVTVTVESDEPDPQFGGPLTATVFSNIDLRNAGL
jgi:type II secretory pathway pseudopilin PulG